MENLALKRENRPHLLKTSRFKYEDNSDVRLLEEIFDSTKELKEISMDEIIDEITLARREDNL